MKTEAKAIFIAYCGNGFFMMQDGVYQDYKRFEVTPSQETEWAIEFGEQLLKDFIESRGLDRGLDKLIGLIGTFNLISLLKSLTIAVSKLEADLDGFTKLLACEDILKTLAILRSKHRTKIDVVNEIKKTIEPVVASLSHDQFTINDIYKQEIQIFGTLSERSIQQRIMDITNYVKTCYI